MVPLPFGISPARSSIGDLIAAKNQRKFKIYEKRRIE
jgi:hypothetical protein